MPILYAKVGGPPDNWASLILKKNGVKRERIMEIDVLGCWAIVDEPDGQGGRIGVKEYGNWTIEEPATGGYFRGKVNLLDSAIPVDPRDVVHNGAGSGNQPYDIIPPPGDAYDPDPVAPPQQHPHARGIWPIVAPITSDDDPGDADPYPSVWALRDKNSATMLGLISMRMAGAISHDYFWSNYNRLFSKTEKAQFLNGDWAVDPSEEKEEDR